MNFSFTAEQDTFRAEARRFFAERVDVRAQIAMRGAHDPALWKEMASLGFLGLPLYWYDRLWQAPIRGIASLAGIQAPPVVTPTPGSDGFQSALNERATSIVYSTAQYGTVYRSKRFTSPQPYDYTPHYVSTESTPLSEWIL